MQRRSKAATGKRLNPEFCRAAIDQRGLLQLPLSPKDHSTCLDQPVELVGCGS